jgi:2Fe-2S ferredoxin
MYMKVLVITADGQEMELQAESGDPLMYVLRNASLIEASCGGQAACATCHVIVDPSWIERVGQPDGQEADLLESSMERSETSRLSCQVILNDSLDNLAVRIAPPEG